MNERQAVNVESLFASHYARLCYFASTMLEDQAAAEDVVQDAFLKFWDRKEGFPGLQEAKGFLYTTVRNACLNLIRHSKVERKFVASRNATADMDQGFGLDHMVRAEVLGEIHQAIESLPEGCKQVLKLSYYESLKNEEIAGVLGVSINTVKTQKSRALQLLRLRLTLPAYLLFLQIYG